jgi:hypothetical protein
MSRPQLHLISDDGDLDLKMSMGDGPATPTAGLSGYETIKRVRRKAMTSFVGTEPFAQDVPVMLDGYREGRSIERQLDLLLDFGGTTKFKAFGPIHRPSDGTGDLYFFGDEPEFGDAIRDEDGTLLRQRLTLKLEEFVPANLAGKPRRRNERIGQSRPLSYTTVKGDTLAKIAHKLYHDWTRWKEIGRKNGLSDPHRVLPPNKELKL